MKRFGPIAMALAGFIVIVALTSPVGATGAATSHMKALRGKTGRSRTGRSLGYEPLCASRSSLCIDAYDNPGDEYVGHDEPSIEFKSGVPGSGNDMTYTVTLPTDPHARPAATGAGGTWNFQLRPTFWFRADAL